MRFDEEALLPAPSDTPLESRQPEYIPPPRGNATPPSAATGCYGQEECWPDGGPPCYGPSERFWIRADYMMWWTSGTELPPLVVAGPPGTPATQIEVVYGDSTVLTGGRTAVRTTIGGWLDRCQRWAIEADWLYLSGMKNHFEDTTTTGLQVGRPLYDLENNVLSYELADWVAVDGEDYFNSMGLWFRYNLCCSDPCCEDCCASCDSCGEVGCGGSCEPACGTGCAPCRSCRTDLLVGYRYYTLGDRLSIHEALTTQTPAASFDIIDSFRTRNEFHGVDVGLSTQWQRGCWGLSVLAKMALGNSRQIAYINGVTRQTTQGVTNTYDNGIYATLSNMGTYTRDQFTIIPQLSLELSCQLTCRLRGYVGYNILYWAPVWRAGDQVDLFIDPRNWAPLPQPDRLPLPTFPGQYSNFWAQGVNAGLELRF
ncbi:MAG: BBP7 family outer membrane beta-barrel protein [Pirellulales bacterium]|nr:BBP7 family outer membrane beta-barrel protein [Pirellulales bacterium]